jgi:hypothetical protein
MDGSFTKVSVLLGCITGLTVRTSAAAKLCSALNFGDLNLSASAPHCRKLKPNCALGFSEIPDACYNLPHCADRQKSNAVEPVQEI